VTRHDSTRHSGPSKSSLVLLSIAAAQAASIDRFTSAGSASVESTHAVSTCDGEKRAAK
jgi:hypothetical protein